MGLGAIQKHMLVCQGYIFILLSPTWHFGRKC